MISRNERADIRLRDLRLARRRAVTGNGSARDSIREWMNGLKSGGIGGEQTTATMRDKIGLQQLRTR